ncbi:hypothetical protein GCM10023114_59480 [Mycolicibacterium sediminis]|uniref:Uncharacterized protein n=1 Tax=Mycolicibacterium sediminis TaxID=1286180 RepID=A0A7I7R0J2_9MYCO|nr:hypothetical protein MSEDJ_58330 [Mycolicibacterium sediminis]
MTGDQRPLQLRQDGVLETQDAGPHVASLGQRGEQVLPDLVLDATLSVAGCAEFADGTWEVCR